MRTNDDNIPENKSLIKYWMFGKSTFPYMSQSRKIYTFDKESDMEGLNFKGMWTSYCLYKSPGMQWYVKSLSQG